MMRFLCLSVLHLLVGCNVAFECEKGFICGTDCGMATPIVMQKIKFRNVQFTFPSNTTARSTILIPLDIVPLIKESEALASIDNKIISTAKFCDTFPSLCFALDGIQFNCDLAYGNTYRCKDISYPVRLQQAKGIQSGTYKEMQFEVSHKTKGLLQCISMNDVKIEVDQ